MPWIFLDSALAFPRRLLTFWRSRRAGSVFFGTGISTTPSKQAGTFSLWTSTRREKKTAIKSNTLRSSEEIVRKNDGERCKQVKTKAWYYWTAWSRRKGSEDWWWSFFRSGRTRKSKSKGSNFCARRLWSLWKTQTVRWPSQHCILSTSLFTFFVVVAWKRTIINGWVCFYNILTSNFQTNIKHSNPTTTNQRLDRQVDQKFSYWREPRACCCSYRMCDWRKLGSRNMCGFSRCRFSSLPPSNKAR